MAMSEAGEALLYGEQVSEWFQRSAGIFEGLSACCVLVESILDGDPAANLAGPRSGSAPRPWMRSASSRPTRVPTRGVRVSCIPSCRR